ncbi:MAG: amidohydrolase family protein [Candidatus Marinimicrobia bacterium]|nr:amidohydrolase family protein [Candidatus Neomarinimicrobiota bacterium]
MRTEQFSGDILLLNGDIRVSPPWDVSVPALLIQDGIVTAHGEAALARQEEFPDHNIIDLKQRTVLPGFTDSHLHLSMLGERLSQLDFPENSAREDIQSQVADAARNSAPGKWIIGGKWSRHALGGFPDKSLLDEVAPENPVALYSKDLHSVLINSVALTQARITAETADPPGGKIVRNDQNEPTGVLQEDAMDLFERARPEKGINDFRKEHGLAANHCHQYGITSVHSIENWKNFTRYQQMLEDGQLQIRAGCLIYKDDLDAIIDAGLRSSQGDEWLWLIGVKAFADGALGSRTAWMKQPYESTDDRGMPLLSRDDLVNLRRRCHSHELSTGIHAIGDAAVDLCLDIFTGGENGLQDRIEHLQLIDEGDLDKISSHISAAVQPVHLLGDRNPADTWWGERAQYAYAFRTLLDRGANLAFGSDAPVEDVNPWLSVQAAVERRSAPDEQQWYPQECISVNAAITAFTSGSAHLGYRGQQMGTIRIGALGDAVVLNRNPWKVAPTELQTIQPDMTIVNGVRVYSNG